MIPLSALHLALALEQAAMPLKPRPIPISGVTLKDGKIIKKKKKASVSEQIRMRKSKKVRPVRRTAE